MTDEHGVPTFLYKVGVTTLDPFERARQLTAATASPTPFHVCHYRWAKDANQAEALAHEMLDEFRVNDGREFFKAPLGTVIGVVDRVTGFGARVTETPWAELFASFPDDGSARALTPEERQQCRKLAGKLAAKREWRDAA